MHSHVRQYLSSGSWYTKTLCLSSNTLISLNQAM